MTNGEALNILYKGIAPNPTANNECIELCKKALEKQIPKKPFLYSFSESHDTYTYFKCPNLCDTYCEVKNNMNFCPNCGQALDWSDSE